MKYRGHEKNQQFLSLNDSSFCLKKRKNHPRKRLSKTIKTNEKKEYQRENQNNHYTPSPPPSYLRIFEEEEEKKKKNKKRKKEFLPQFRPRVLPVTECRGHGRKRIKIPSRHNVSLGKNAGTGRIPVRLPVLEASASSLNVSKRARRRDIFTRTGRLRWIGGNGPAAVLRK